MIRTELRTPWLLAAASACVLLVASCESTTRVGRECRAGGCPRANRVRPQSGVVPPAAAEIAVVRAIDEDPESAAAIRMCLPRAQSANSLGHVACRVLSRLGEVEIPDGGAVAS